MDDEEDNKENKINEILKENSENESTENLKVEEVEVKEKIEKPNPKKYPKVSLTKLNEGDEEIGQDGNQYIVTLNKLNRKFWKKV